MPPLKLRFPSTWAFPLTSSFAAGAVAPVPMPTFPADCDIVELVRVVLFFQTAIRPALPVPEMAGVAGPLDAQS